MKTGWSETPTEVFPDKEANEAAANRRVQLMEAFPDDLILIPASVAVVRSNDTNYRYRPSTEFTQLTNWGSQTVEGSLLVLDSKNNECTLFMRPSADKDSDEFFANSEIGEFWVGPRPDLQQVAALLNIETADINKFDAEKKLESDL